MVRRAALPAVQINVARQQVNEVNGEDSASDDEDFSIGQAQWTSQPGKCRGLQTRSRTRSRRSSTTWSAHGVRQRRLATWACRDNRFNGTLPRPVSRVLHILPDYDCRSEHRLHFWVQFEVSSSLALADLMELRFPGSKADCERAAVSPEGARMSAGYSSLPRDPAPTVD